MGAEQSFEVSDVPSNVFLENILQNPDLTPPDVVALCKQPGSVFFCNDPDVSRSLMNHYYPGLLDEENGDDIWYQFLDWTNEDTTEYYAHFSNEEFVNLFEFAQYDNFEQYQNAVNQGLDDREVFFHPPLPFTEASMVDLGADQQTVRLVLDGYPRFGTYWVSGIIFEPDGNSVRSDFRIYETRELAIDDLFKIYVDTIHDEIISQESRGELILEDESHLLIAGDINWIDLPDYDNYNNTDLRKQFYTRIFPPDGSQNYITILIVDPDSEEHHYVIFHIGKVNLTFAG